MKVLGITTGRRFGNSEVLLRYALRAIKEVGHEVELIRLQDYRINPCTGCVSCMKRGNEADLPRPCVFDKDDSDDGAFILEKILRCDGLILAVPNMDLMPHGLIIDLTNRSIAINERGRYIRDKNSKVPEYGKVTATIGVGGSDWTHFQMSILNLCAIWLSGARVALADQMLVQHVETPGIVAALESACERAELLGRHVAMELGKDESSIQYHGDMAEACPVCHCDTLLLREGRLVCPLCNLEGDPLIVDGKIQKIQFDYGIERSHWSLFGKLDHDKNVDTHVKRDATGKKVISEEQRLIMANKRKMLSEIVMPTLPPRKHTAQKKRISEN